MRIERFEDIEAWQLARELTRKVYPNVANVGGLQIQGLKGDVVVVYFEPLTTQKLKSSGVPVG